MIYKSATEIDSTDDFFHFSSVRDT